MIINDYYTCINDNNSYIKYKKNINNYSFILLNDDDWIKKNKSQITNTLIKINNDNNDNDDNDDNDDYYIKKSFNFLIINNKNLLKKIYKLTNNNNNLYNKYKKYKYLYKENLEIIKSLNKNNYLLNNNNKNNINNNNIIYNIILLLNIIYLLYINKYLFI